jgi:glycosyltransferase involved in cell wall biosynthesis
MMNRQSTMTVAMLLSCDSFESFYGSVLQLDRDRFVQKYRNDWSWYYAGGLLENGIQPILYIPSLQYEGYFDTEVGIGIRFLKLAQWYRPLAKLRRAMRATRWSLYLQERANAAAFTDALRRAIAADGVDLLYVQEYWTGRFDHLVHRSPVPVSAVDQGGLSQGVVKWFKRKAMARAVAIYAQTTDECEQVRRYFPSPTLQPNGGDTTFFSPPPPGSPRSQNIVTVARLTDKQKRTSDLIRAMTLLDSKWTLDIIGTGPDGEMLKALAAQLNVADRVRFRGFQSKTQIRAVNQQCGVYAMPSSNEGVCLALLEAMGCGAAIVASHIRAFETVIQDGVNGMLFTVGDVPGLARAIEAAWTQRQQLGAAAAEAVSSNFNSRILYRRLAESMRQSIGASRHAVRETEPVMAGV